MTEHYLDRLAKTINKNWNQPALTDFYLSEDGTAQDTLHGNHYTYGEMYEEILHVCDIFHTLGLQKGDHIAICGANSTHWTIAYLAIAAYQGVSVTIIYSQTTEDIAWQIDFSDAKALFTDADLWEELKSQSLPQVEHVINLDDWQILHGKPIFNLQSSISNIEARFIHGNPNELAHICFTSGSTGAAHGVMLPYRSINNNVDNLLRNYIVSDNHNSFVFLQFSHAGELLCDLLQQLCRGKHIFISQVILHPKNIYQSLKVISPYMVFVVPRVLSVLTQEYDMRELKSIRQIVTAGALLDEKTEKELERLGIPITNEYGLTECLILSSSSVTSYRHSSVGKILPTVIARIAPNGEILVKGENVMLGYYKDPEATARKIDKDGWLHTGDKGRLDADGYLYVEGRLEQDMIVLPNGENIHPEDIERKINALPEVKESIVLARDGKLVAIVVADTDLRRHVLRTINPELPLYSQLYDVEITDVPLQKTEKQTIKRYLYK